MRVPSSLAIYVAAAGLINYKKRKAQFAQTSSQKAPHKSLAPQLVQWGGKEKRETQQVGAFDFEFLSPLSLPSIV